MKISLWPNMSHAPAEVLDLARWADATGWHGVWYADHYMPNTGSEEFTPGDTHECWAMLPAIAAVTQRVRVGPLVTPTSVHHPAVLANRAATIDHLSNGRMVLGLGAGWQINEHRAYGIELEPPKARVDRFDEAIQVIRSLLSEDRTTFDGAVYTITDAPSDPSPVQSPLPILVGSSSPRMLRITARHADEWNAWGSPEIAAEKRARFEQACEAVGRDPASIWTSAQALVHLTATDADGDAIVAAGAGPGTIAGTTNRLVEQLGRYDELGFDEFIVPDWTMGATPAERRESLERFDADVVGQLT
ncbi:MAG: LLM class flavin-dependent oxidoreductase [Ilumatobacter sp.]|uniref:LLM class flavin-dependent oxidoreductase n=1 Tax=Ilumatobacter sp. TaxID=1967498 RepID=UPI0026173816|nr:LLM class flavin-dependent oxidoreductase [Ilumatobacter sp.]MDJ0771048.1 LLM class flavin-dependent oxidoreductase [Ilumatobacter sp.]